MGSVVDWGELRAGKEWKNVWEMNTEKGDGCHCVVFIPALWARQVTYGSLQKEVGTSHVGLQATEPIFILLISLIHRNKIPLQRAPIDLGRYSYK